MSIKFENVWPAQSNLFLTPLSKKTMEEPTNMGASGLSVGSSCII